MKSLLFSRTLVITGLALSPVTWLVSGCGGGGGGGGGNNNNPPQATRTPTATRTATPTNTAAPGGTPNPTPIPTPLVPAGGQRVVAEIGLGQGQTGTLNIIINRFGNIYGLITVRPIPADKVGTFQVAPGTYAITGAFSLPNNFRFSGTLKTVTNVDVPFTAVGKSASNGNPGTITVTVGNTTYPTSNF